jgi:hypothetical protein
MICFYCRGSPKSAGNALQALAALAGAVSEYANQLDAEEAKVVSEVSEHLGQGHWLSMVANTLLAIVDVRYEPSSRVFNICPQV